MKSPPYFPLLFKRALKKYPYILLITLATLASVALCAVMILSSPKDEKDTAKVAVGIVGDTSDTFMNLGIDLVTEIDDSRFYIDIRRMSSSEEAESAMKNDEILGYINIPEDFIYGIAEMDNIPAVYYMPNRPESLGTALTKEVIDTVAIYVTESQKAVNALARYIRANKLDWGRSLDELSLFLVTGSVLMRNKFLSVEYTGFTGHVSAGGYYIAGLLLFFLLLLGISFSCLLVRKDETFPKYLRSRGVSAVSQVISEYAVYLILTVISLLVIALIAGVALGGNDFGIRELYGKSVLFFAMYIIKIIPVILAVTSMQFFIYEMTSGTVASVLAQFITAILSAYLCGCFYPNHFFPETVRSIISVFPQGVGAQYMRDTLCGTTCARTILILIGYTVLFTALTVLKRNFRMAGDAS